MSARPAELRIQPNSINWPRIGFGWSLGPHRDVRINSVGLFLQPQGVCGRPLASEPNQRTARLSASPTQSFVTLATPLQNYIAVPNHGLRTTDLAVAKARRWQCLVNLESNARSIVLCRSRGITGERRQGRSRVSFLGTCIRPCRFRLPVARHSAGAGATTPTAIIRNQTSPR